MWNRVQSIENFSSFPENFLDLKPDSPKVEHGHCTRKRVEILNGDHTDSAYPKLQFLFASWHASNLVKLCLDHRNLKDNQIKKVNIYGSSPQLTE